MKEQNFLIAEECESFIDLSEKLRGCLEAKIDELSQKISFQIYFNKRCSFFSAPDNDEQLVLSIIGAKNDNKVFAHSASISVKTWYSMYYDDRISVLEKFHSYCRKLSRNNDLLSTVDISFIFSKVLLIELAAILNDMKWKPIRMHYQRVHNAI